MATVRDAASAVRKLGGPAEVPLVDVARPEGVPDPGVPPDHRGRLPTSRLPSGVRGVLAVRWPLFAVLAVQAALSLRLVWSNTAFQDEALYLRAGHLEWAQWLHQAPIPNFPAYFSGAPVIYPPLGAVADSLGGLAAARVLSLCFMLGVTSLLWATTARLYGRRAALLAAGLFATLAGTQFLGALATFDAMALFLLTLATWLGVRSADCQVRTRTALLVTAGVILAAADAVKYATALFTPVVLIVVALAAWRRPGRGRWLAALLTMACSWLVLIVAAVAAGGRTYWLGVTASTLARPPSDAPVTTVLRSAYIWTSLILVLAALGAVLASRGQGRGKLLPAVLAAAALLVPAEQARLHTTVSLQKHVVFGAWFAAIAAGYAMARLSRVDPGHGWAPVMALPIAASTLFGSMGQAASLYQGLAGLDRGRPGPARGDPLPPGQLPGRRLRRRGLLPAAPRLPGRDGRAPTTSATSRPSRARRPMRPRSASHYFSLVILDFGDTSGD